MKKIVFEVVQDAYRMHPDAVICPPVRATNHAVGHDFSTPEDIDLLPGDSVTVWTDIKAKFPPNYGLFLFIRSSLGRKGVTLANSVGVVDSDYYGNPQNDGNIGVCLVNHSSEPVHISKGERVAQGVCMPCLVAPIDKETGKRDGGFGSTGR